MFIRSTTRPLFATAAALAFAIGSTPVAAADDEDVALLAFLGLEAAKGETTVGDKGGQLESYILSTYMLKSAGAKINSQITGDDIVLLSHDEKFDLTAIGKVNARLDLAERTMAAVQKICAGRAQEAEIKGLSLSAKNISQSIVGAIKTDTNISGIEVSVDDQMLINAIAGATADPTKYTIPSENVWLDFSLDGDGPFKRARDLQGELDALSGDNCLKQDPVKSAFAAVKGLLTTITAPGDKQGPSLLESAIKLSDYANSNVKVLRVKAIKAGGTLIKRSNIWTTLGLMRGETISGGLIATYRLIDPKTGLVETAGSIVCRTKARKMAEINSGVLKGPDADGRLAAELTDADNCTLIA